MTNDSSIALYNAVSDDTNKYFSNYEISLMERGVFSWPGQTLKQIYGASLRQSLLKKYLPDAKSLELPNSVALKKFLLINDSCASFQLNPRRLSHELILNEMKTIIHKFWFSLSDRGLEGHPFDSLDRGQMGPGASNGVVGNDFYTKLFSAKLTSSSSTLVIFYKHYLSKSLSWLEAERLRESIYGTPQIVDGNRPDRKSVV